MRYFSFRNILIVLFIVIFLLFLKFIDGYFSDPVKSYVEQRVRLHTASIVEQAIREDVLNELDPETLINIKKNGGTVENIIVNTYQTNKIMADVMKSVTEEINTFNQGELNLELPLLMVISDTMFLEYGPKVNIYIKPVSSVKVDVISRLTEFGINNTLLEVVLKTEVHFQTLIPFQKNTLVVTNELPLLIEVITGDIPRYYYQGGTTIPLTPQDNDGPSETDIPEMDT
ncbi:sporulation protein YunB [Mycoplasmatota bacterium WC44]